MSSLNQLPSLQTTITAYGLAPRKALGQHFLLDQSTTDQIAKLAGDLTQHHVIEIGPGPGGLTRALINANAKHVTAVEMDSRCISALNDIQRIMPDRFTIIEADGLKIKLLEHTKAPRKIIANLPYNVGTPMLINWLHDIYHHREDSYDSMTLMFQKEVAERIVAQPGSKNFGRLSVISQWLCETDYAMELPPEAFSPPPKVHSAVVTLIPRKKPLIDVSIKSIEHIMAKAFGQRRKMLRGALKGLSIAPEILLEAAAIDGTKRAEQLELMDLCRLAQCYEQLMKKA